MDGQAIDTRLLSELTEQSQDLHSDATRITTAALGAFADGQDGVRANANDIMALQTAASIENLAVSVYTTAAGLGFIKSGNATVAAFIAKTTAQHQAHATAFNTALTQAGAKTQSKPDPKYAAVVNSALPGIKGPGDVVALALTLEDVGSSKQSPNMPTGPPAPPPTPATCRSSPSPPHWRTRPSAPTRRRYRRRGPASSAPFRPRWRRSPRRR
jgi:hypothetical protein